MHNRPGELVGYVGRWPGGQPEGTPWERNHTPPASAGSAPAPHHTSKFPLDAKTSLGKLPQPYRHQPLRRPSLSEHQFMSDPNFDWKTLLTQLSAAMIESEGLEFMEAVYSHFHIPPLTKTDKEIPWLGFAPATDASIAAGESRLGLRLPESLRNFYRVSNGWRQVSSSIYEIVPIEDLRLLKDADLDLFDMIEDSCDLPELEYCREEQVTAVRRSICLAMKGDATTLLIDPENCTSDGEWIVGNWASWNPGAEWSDGGFLKFMQERLVEAEGQSDDAGDEVVDPNA